MQLFDKEDEFNVIQGSRKERSIQGQKEDEQGVYCGDCSRCVAKRKPCGKA